MPKSTEYSRSLVSQASRLLEKRQGRPNSADVRRAVSNAYYALFHHITDGAIDLLLGKSVDLVVRGYFSRSFNHGTMKNVCEKVEKGASPDRNKAIIESLPGKRFSGPIIEIAKNFVILQKARHDADYAINYNYRLVDAKSELNMAIATITSFELAKQNSPDELLKFCSLLLLAKN